MVFACAKIEPFSYFLYELLKNPMDCPTTEQDFYSWLTAQDFSECEPRTLKLLIYFLQENKNLASTNCELQERLHSLQEKLYTWENAKPEESSPYLFSSRNCFLLWTAERFHEIENGLTLLQKNYPREGMESSRKIHVDFLFQDINEQYLLLNLYFFDRRLRDDPMNPLSSLNEAHDHLLKELCISSSKVRKMIISNTREQGIEDLCAVNNTEFVCIQGSYSITR